MKKNMTQYLGTAVREHFKPYGKIYLVGWNTDCPTPSQVMALALYAVAAGVPQYQVNDTLTLVIAGSRIMTIKPDDKEYQSGTLLRDNDIAILGEMNLHEHAEGALLASDFIYRLYPTLLLEGYAKFLDANLFGELLSIEAGLVNLDRGEVNIYTLIQSVLGIHRGSGNVNKFAITFCMDIINGYLSKYDNLAMSNMVSVVNELYATFTNATPSNLASLKQLIQLGLEQQSNENENGELGGLYQEVIGSLTIIIKDKIDNPFFYEPTDKQLQLGSRVEYDPRKGVRVNHDDELNGE